MSMSRGHGIDLHCLSPAASPASSLDFLSLSLSVPQIHQPLLYSGPLDPSFHCLEPPLCLLLTDPYSQVTRETWVCQAGLLLREMRPPTSLSPFLTLLCWLLSHLFPPLAWKGGSCVSSRDPSTCLGAWAQDSSAISARLWKHPGCRWTTFQSQMLLFSSWTRDLVANKFQVWWGEGIRVRTHVSFK